MKHYSKDEALNELPGWNYKNEGVEKDFLFKDFSQAFGFMARVALLCESADHHPEWSNVYNKVHLRLSTHSEKALTEKDIELAKKIDML